MATLNDGVIVFLSWERKRVSKHEQQSFPLDSTLLLLLRLLPLLLLLKDLIVSFDLKMGTSYFIVFTCNNTVRTTGLSS